MKLNYKNEFNQIVGPAVENWTPRALPSVTTMLGDYCRLDALNIDLHAHALFEAFQFNNQGETWTYLPFGPFSSYPSFKNWLTNAISKGMYFAIFDLNLSAPQGIAAYHNIEPDDGVIEVGSLHYSKYLQRSRISTEAMYLMMRYVFEDLGYRRYQWRANTLNTPSRRAAERLGFKFEGIFRQAQVLKGHSRDSAWYSIIDSEWPELKEKFQRWLSAQNFDKEGQQLTKLE